MACRSLPLYDDYDDDDLDPTDFSYFFSFSLFSFELGKRDMLGMLCFVFSCDYSDTRVHMEF
jgi:hypothetical protein